MVEISIWKRDIRNPSFKTKIKKCSVPFSGNNKQNNTHTHTNSSSPWNMFSSFVFVYVARGCCKCCYISHFICLFLGKINRTPTFLPHPLFVILGYSLSHLRGYVAKIYRSVYFDLLLYFTHDLMMFANSVYINFCWPNRSDRFANSLYLYIYNKSNGLVPVYSVDFQSIFPT